MAKMYTAPPKFSQIPSVIRDDVPVYFLEDSCYFDETHFLAGAILETTPDMVPNLAMFPLNELAKVRKVEFLTAYDEGGKEFQAQTKRAYVKKLPAFLHKWETVNQMAAQKRMHLVMVLKTMQVPILGAPPKPKSVFSVDMTSIPQVPYEDGTAIGKGNTMDKVSTIDAVRASVA